LRVKREDVLKRVVAIRIKGPSLYCFVDDGAGITRFKFDVHPIFSFHEEGGIAVAFGAKQAMLWLDGFEAGVTAERTETKEHLAEFAEGLCPADYEAAEHQGIIERAKD
jgi:hypothetical protein